MDWSQAEQAIVVQIMNTESQLAPGASDMRVLCQRPEALRRLRRRTREGIYREPKFSMQVNLLPPTPRHEQTPAQIAAFRERLKGTQRQQVSS